MTSTNPQNKWRAVLSTALCGAVAVLVAVESPATLQAQVPAGPGRGAAPPAEALFTSAQALAGKAAYERNCATCHGDGGKGDGPGAGQADPAPYDFTRREFAGMRRAPGAAVLYAILARGIDGTMMKAYPNLGGWERLAVLAWVTTLPGREAIGASAAWADTLRNRRPGH